MSVLFRLICCSLLATVAFVPHATAAQEALSVTVTPPLIQLTIGPGESWESVLKIVNTNPYDVTYYATPVDFRAEGEGGKGEFIPLMDSPESAYSLGHWVEITREPITVPQGSSREIPFVVSIPGDASPGGHYAAVLVGTKPGEEVFEGSGVKVSSFVSSLLFVRIRGEVVEQGRIREFHSEASMYQSPRADFVLRFENTGNTHLRPQGDITLYNMWGKERGRVQLSQKSNFGNVLPGSIRRFEFSWTGERSMLDIGRYKALVTIAYGEDEKQNTSAATYFWVVPIVPVSITLGSVFAFILLTAWLIRRYIRRALAIEQNRHGIFSENSPRVNVYSFGTLVEPFKEGAVDLRSLAKRPVQQPIPATVYTPTVTGDQKKLTLLGFLQKYSLFFFSVALLMAGGFGAWMYLETVLIPEREFQITDISAQDEVSDVEI